MTDAAAFLNEVLVHPDDDGPRLVFADWLEEQGDCERAEFIRVQVELAELGEPRIILGGSDDAAGKCVMQSHGPDYWETYSHFEVDVGQRVDVECISMSSSKNYKRHGLVVTKHEDRGSEGKWYVLKRDAKSKPFPLRRYDSLRRRADELLAANQVTWRMQDLPGIAFGNIVTDYRRGMVEGVECRLLDFAGGEICQGCKGNKGEWDYGPGYASRWLDCPLCHGTGRTPGLGALIVQRTPLREVRTEAKPLVFKSNASWWDARMQDGTDGHPESSLPHDIFEMIKAVTHIGTRSKWFATADAARAALSEALLRLAREQAKVMPKEVVA